MTDDDVWERSMRLAEAANMDPMHGEPVPGRDYPEEPTRRPTPPGWAQPLIMLAYMVAWPFVALWRRVVLGKKGPGR